MRLRWKTYRLRTRYCSNWDASGFDFLHAVKNESPETQENVVIDNAIISGAWFDFYGGAYFTADVYKAVL